MKNLRYSTEIANKVKKNWLTIKYKEEFKQCKSNADWCLTFARVSNMKDSEKDLQKIIVEIFYHQMIKSKILKPNKK